MNTNETRIYPYNLELLAYARVDKKRADKWCQEHITEWLARPEPRGRLWLGSQYGIQRRPNDTTFVYFEAVEVIGRDANGQPVFSERETFGLDIKLIHNSDGSKRGGFIAIYQDSDKSYSFDWMRPCLYYEIKAMLESPDSRCPRCA